MTQSYSYNFVTKEYEPFDIEKWDEYIPRDNPAALEFAANYEEDTDD